MTQWRTDQRDRVGFQSTEWVLSSYKAFLNPISSAKYLLQSQSQISLAISTTPAQNSNVTLIVKMVVNILHIVQYSSTLDN